MADFPTSVKTFPTLSDFTDSVLAAHQNERGEEITAIENYLVEAASEVTVASGVLTVTKSRHKVQPETGTSDDIDTISGMPDNSLLILYASDAGTDSLTLKHGTGNISCLGGVNIVVSEGFALCFYDGTTVYVTGGDGGGSSPITHTSTVVYTADATWTKADYAGIYAVKVKVIGGGGGGGGVTGASSQAASGGGGGGGGYSEKFILAASLGATETVTVGAGGTAGAAGNNAGGTGGTSSFGAHCSATGGAGGSGQAASTAVNRAGGLAGAGGAGSGGDINLTGGCGITGAIYTVTNGISGAGGMSAGLSSSGGAQKTADGAGNAGSAYGGGGGGAISTSNAVNRAGGAGGAGVVIVEIYKTA